jgi:hypothetical protein
LGKNPFFHKITKPKQTHEPQITSRVVATQYGERPTTQIISVAHQASILSIPRANSRLARGPGAATQISASLEGYAPPRANFRLARGLRAPSGGSPPRLRATRPTSSESPPRSRVSRVHNPRAHSPDRSIKCSDTPRAPGVKGESSPRRPSDTAWESYPRRCSANPPREANPGTVGEQCGRAGVNSVTLCRPLPYGLRAPPLERGRQNPRKGYGRLPCAHTG